MSRERASSARDTTTVGALLQYWRGARRKSQLALAHDAGVSPRHVCFIETGRARLMKGPGDDATVVKVIKPGMTVKVRPGQWLREEQGEIHHAENAGDVPIVIYLATLLKTGEPAAIPD